MPKTPGSVESSRICDRNINDQFYPHQHRRSKGGPRGHAPQKKFLAYLVILCFEKRCAKRKYCCLPKAKHLLPQILGWLRYCTLVAILRKLMQINKLLLCSTPPQITCGRVCQTLIDDPSSRMRIFSGEWNLRCVEDIIDRACCAFLMCAMKPSERRAGQQLRCTTYEAKLLGNYFVNPPQFFLFRTTLGSFKFKMSRALCLTRKQMLF